MLTICLVRLSWMWYDWFDFGTPFDGSSLRLMLHLWLFRFAGNVTTIFVSKKILQDLFDIVWWSYLIYFVLFEFIIYRNQSEIYLMSHNYIEDVTTTLIGTTQQKKSKTNFKNCYVCEKISHKATKSGLVIV
jgi:hypothetical protein